MGDLLSETLTKLCRLTESRQYLQERGLTPDECRKIVEARNTIANIYERIERSMETEPEMGFC